MTGAVRLVIAEDNLLVREGLVSLLATAGDFAVITACSSLDELYEAVERDHPDVVITDIRMPGRYDGWTLAVRARELRPDLPVIYLSGYSEDGLKPVSGGVFVRKPYRLSDIGDALAKIGLR